MYYILPMTLPMAMEIVHWTYPDEYAIYSFDGSDESVEELLCGDYYGCLDDNDRLIGGYCFGVSAQIPTMEDDPYTSDFLDIGVCLKPELCGQGFGREFFTMGMEFAQEVMKASSLRLTVAEFNKRAIHLYENCGFTVKQSVTHRYMQKPFFIMER